MSNLLPQNINTYIDAHSSPESDLLHRLRRETHIKVLYPQMLSSHLAGRFLAMMSRLVRPKRILEIGTYTGYSCICLAEGLTKEGKIFTIEINQELKARAKSYFEEAGISHKVEMRTGDAQQIIPELDEVFDLIFMDADKRNYPNYLKLILPKLRPGGLLLVDNVLWSGKVADDSVQDKDTQGIRLLNQMAVISEETDCVLLPLRDGIMLIQKKDKKTKT